MAKSNNRTGSLKRSSKQICSCCSSGFELWGSCKLQAQIAWQKLSAPFPLHFLRGISGDVMSTCYRSLGGGGLKVLDLCPPHPSCDLKSLRYQAQSYLAQDKQVANKTPASSKELASFHDLHHEKHTHTHTQAAACFVVSFFRSASHCLEMLAHTLRGFRQTNVAWSGSLPSSHRAF